MYTQTVKFNGLSDKKCIILYAILPCLAFNHPRSEGWSLHGQVSSTSFCLSSSSIGLQTALNAISR